MIKIIFFGTGIRGETCLLELSKANREIVAVIGQTGSSAIVDLAKKLGIDSYQPEKVNNEDFIQIIRSYQADLMILAGYNKILKPNLLSIPKLGTINLHGGRLPQYRGVAPINWQLINGEKIGGFSIIFVDEGIDTGNIIRKTEFNIGINDTASELLDRSLQWFPGKLIEIVEEFEKNGKVKSEVQDEKMAVHYTRRYLEDGLINWMAMTDMQIHNTVRALGSPYPGAFVFIDGKKLIISKTLLIDYEYRGIPGRIQLKNQNGVIAIACNRGILIQRVLIDGKEENASDHLKVGQKFDSVT